MTAGASVVLLAPRVVVPVPVTEPVVVADQGAAWVGSALQLEHARGPALWAGYPFGLAEFVDGCQGLTLKNATV
jgi:hypothetical protein